MADPFWKVLAVVCFANRGFLSRTGVLNGLAISGGTFFAASLRQIQEYSSTCCSEGDLTSPLRPRSECDLWKLRGGCCIRPPPPTSGWWWGSPPPRGAWKVSWGLPPPPREYSMVLHTEYTPGLCSIWNGNVESKAVKHKESLIGILVDLILSWDYLSAFTWYSS